MEKKQWKDNPAWQKNLAYITAGFLGFVILIVILATNDKPKETQPAIKTSKEIQTPTEPEQPKNYYTKSGYFFGSYKQEYFDQASTYLSQNDTKTFGVMLATGKIFKIQGNNKVFLDESTWGGEVKIHYEGDTRSFWTVSEAIEKR